MSSSRYRCEDSISQRMESSKFQEGHHPRGTALREALRGNLPLRGLCGGLSEGSAGSLRGFCGVSAGLCGGPRDFPRVFGGSDPMLVTLANCWRIANCCVSKLQIPNVEQPRQVQGAQTFRNYKSREWPRYCRKVYWTKMVQHDLIPNWILAFARPKWSILVHFSLKRSI